MVPYGMRHTFASFSIAAGVSLFYLARLMGTSVEQNDNTYGHPLPDSKDVRGSSTITTFLPVRFPRRAEEVLGIVKTRRVAPTVAGRRPSNRHRLRLLRPPLPPPPSLLCGRSDAYASRVPRTPSPSRGVAPRAEHGQQVAYRLIRG